MKNPGERWLIIAGSRDLFLYTDQIVRAYAVHSNVLGEFSAIVSGGAKGVDAAGEAFATCHGLPVKRFVADWDKHGKAAGPMRNKAMAEFAHAALIFVHESGPTPGSSNMAAWMLLLQKPVAIIVSRPGGTDR